MLAKPRRTLRCLAALAAVLLGVTTAAHAQAGLYVFSPSMFDNTARVFVTAADGTLSPVTTLGSFSSPQEAVVRGDQRFVYVPNLNTNNVIVIDTSTLSVVQAIPAGTGPAGAVLRPDGRRLYVSNFTGNSISVFDADLASGLLTLSSTIAAVAAGPRGLALTPDNSRLYVAEQNSNTVGVIDTATNTIVATIPVGAAPQQPAMSPDGTRLLVPNVTGNTVSVIDTATNTVNATVTPGTQVARARFSRDGRFYFLTTRASGGLRVYDASTNTLLQSIVLTGTMIDLVVDPQGLFLYAMDFNNGILHELAIDPATGTLTPATTTGAAVVASLGMCEPGMLSLGATFPLANLTALGCLGSTPAFTGGTLRVDTSGLTATQKFSLGSGGGTIDTNGNDLTIAGGISGTGGLTKSGAGTLTLSGANTYSGATTINGGTLAMSGTLGGAMTVNSGGTLIPGIGAPGTITTGGLALSSGATLSIELNGISPGTQYDQLKVTGTVSLGGATLSRTVGYTPSGGNILIIIDNDGTDPVVGTFAGLAQGATFGAAGRTFQISYTGGTGNDVTLTVLKFDQTITFTALGSKTVGDPPFTVSATASSGLTVAFSSATPSVCAVSNTTVTIVGGGTCTITANQAGSAEFNPAAPVMQSFTVAIGCASLAPAQLSVALAALPYSQTITLTNPTTPVTWAIAGTLPAGLTFDGGVIAGTPSGRGAFPITVTATDARGCQASASYSLAISPERRLVAGAGSGDGASVRAFNLGSGVPAAAFTAFGGFSGGVTVAQADVNGDGVVDIISGAGPGGGPSVSVLDGATAAIRLSFFAFDPAFRGGVDVAAGDINGDGVAEILVVGGCAAPAEVRAFDGRTGALVRTYALRTPTWSCGLHVAAGDVNGDGVADLVVGAGTIGSPFVQIIDGSSGAVLRELVAFDPAFTGGVYVAAGDVTGDGYADIIAGAGSGGAPRVRVFDGATGAQIAGTLGDFNAYAAGFPGGVRVAAGDLNGDGRAEIITAAGPGGGPHVRVWDGANGTEIYGLYAFDPSFAGGVFVGGPSGLGRMAIDIAAQTSGAEIRIAGWALREIATSTTGTDAIHAWAYPAAGGAPVFVGAAPARTPRPDVAAAFGGEFLNSGFDFPGTLAAGTYDLVVFARNSRTGRFDLVRVVRITVN